ncbi:CHAT domain-containing protein [Neorhodopirellula pilleata]|uniref:CHAT domain protein n=1 Tax=Neorhodopirellula pilleata TaxID=2714738 RepID=A0A5C6A8E6_9BACT|nr:CHAT domain-containing tetratricopeptide repeat protein [Neorhodopirellula pilleata]TWT95568.1 CHAT domain protein [Neorhodopirellula pilleata]
MLYRSLQTTSTIDRRLTCLALALWLMVVPSSAADEPDSIADWERLANAALQDGDFATSRSLTQRGLDLALDDGPNFSRWVVGVYFVLDLEMSRGRFQESSEFLTRQRTMLDQFDSVPVWVRTTMDETARELAKIESADESDRKKWIELETALAEAVGDEAVAIVDQLIAVESKWFGDDSVGVALNRSRIANIYLDDVDRTDEQVARVGMEVSQMERTFRDTYGEEFATKHVDGPLPLLIRGRWHLARGEQDLAVQAFEECMRAKESLGDQLGVADMVDWQALAYSEKEDWENAEKALQKVISGYVKTDGRDLLPDSRTRRAIALNQLGRHDEAIAELMEVPTDAQTHMISWLTPLTDQIMGNAQWGKEQYDLAAKHYLRSAVGYFDQDQVEESLYRLIDAGDCYSMLDDPITATMLYEQVISQAVLQVPDMDLAVCRESLKEQKRLAEELSEGDADDYRNVYLIEDEDETMVVTSPTRLQSGSDVLADLKTGDRVFRIGQQDDWIHVRYQGKNGFVRSGSLASLWDQKEQEAYDRVDRLLAEDSRRKDRFEQWENQCDAYIQRYDQGDVDGALLDARQTLQLLESIVGKDHFLTAINRSDILSMVREIGGDLVDEKEHALRTMTQYIREFGPDTIETAFAVTDVADVFAQEGNDIDALKYHNQALSIYASVFGPDHQRTLFIANDIALNEYFLGLLDEARERLSHTIEAETSQGNGLSILVSDAHLYLSYIELEDDNFAQAYAEAYQSLSILHRNGLRGADLVRRVESALAAIEVWRGDSAGGMQRLKDLQIARLEVEAEADSMMDYQTALALMIANPVTADPWIARYRDEVLDSHGDDHIQANDIDLMASMNQLQQGNMSLTLTGLDRIRRRVHKYLQAVLSDLPISQQIAFLKMNDQPNLHQSLSLAYLQDSQEVLQKQVQWLINGKAMSDQINGQQIGFLKQLKTPEQFQAFSEWRLIRRQAALSGNPRTRLDQVLAYRKELDGLQEQKLQTLGDDMARRLQDADQPWVDFDAFGQTLDDDEIYIDFIKLTPLQSLLEGKARLESLEFAEPVYAAWSVRNNGEVRFYDLGPAERIERTIAEVRRVIGDSVVDITMTGEQAAEQKLSPVLAELSSQLWEPFASSVQPEERLVISPDAGLWLVPWAALTISNAEDSIGDSPRYLVEEHAIELIVSGRDRLRKYETFPKTPPVIVADPAFDAEIGALQPQSPEPAASRSLVADLAFERVSRLPATRLEAVSIKPRLDKISGQPAILKLGEDAVEGFVKSIHSPHTLVISTHGFFLPSDSSSPILDRFSRQLLQLRSVAPKASPALTSTPSSTDTETPSKPLFALFRCGLLMAGCNDAQNATTAVDDGILTGFEILGLDLRGTELVVLSACDTGLGDIAEGEGVSGLRMAFQLAGANTVLSSLWSVDDLQTAKLMTLFFQAYEPSQSAPDALKNAQRQVIADRRARSQAAHPLLWAAFSITARGSQNEN